MITIKHKFSGATLCEFDVATIREAAEKGKANLYGANLGKEKGKLLDNGFFSIGPLGSRKDWMQAFHTDNGIWIKAGCFFGSLENSAKQSSRPTEITTSHLNTQEYATSLNIILPNR